jgi:chromosome segregation ATPase
MKAAEQDLNSKMEELEERLSTKVRGLDSGSGELEQIKSEMRAVAQRIAEVESAAQRARTLVASDAPLTEQMKSLEQRSCERQRVANRATECGRSLWAVSVRCLSKAVSRCFNPHRLYRVVTIRPTN